MEFLLTYLFIEHSLVAFGLQDQVFDLLVKKLYLLHQQSLLARALVAFHRHFILNFAQLSLAIFILFTQAMPLTLEKTFTLIFFRFNSIKLVLLPLKFVAKVRNLAFFLDN